MNSTAAEQTPNRVAHSSGTTPGGVDLDLVGECLIGIREFSLFLTRTIELGQRDGFSSNNDLMVLIALHLDGPQRPRQLVAVSGLTSGGLSLLLDRLQDSGWIVRRRDTEKDRRAVMVELTDQGRGALDRTYRASAAAFAAGRPLLDRVRRQLEALGHHIPARAKPLSGDLVALRRIVEVGHLLTAAIAEVAGSYGDAANTLHVLWLLGVGGARPVSIGDAIGLSSAGTTGLLDRLEAGGLVRRSSRLESDGRAVVVTATPKGRRVLGDTLIATAPLLGHVADVLFSG